MRIVREKLVKNIKVWSKTWEKKENTSTQKENIIQQKENAKENANKKKETRASDKANLYYLKNSPIMSPPLGKILWENGDEKSGSQQQQRGGNDFVDAHSCTFE